MKEIKSLIFYYWCQLFFIFFFILYLTKLKKYIWFDKRSRNIGGRNKKIRLEIGDK